MNLWGDPEHSPKTSSEYPASRLAEAKSSLEITKAVTELGETSEWPIRAFQKSILSQHARPKQRWHRSTNIAGICGLNNMQLKSQSVPSQIYTCPQKGSCFSGSDVDAQLLILWRSKKKFVVGRLKSVARPATKQWCSQCSVIYTRRSCRTMLHKPRERRTTNLSPIWMI